MNIQKIKPSGIFTNYIFKSIPLAFDESLSYYEVLCGVLDKLKTQEEVINNNADLLAELESYVKNYFDNLDVQEEINNKLDEMAESGELENIISQYIELATTYSYNTIEDMKSSTNLINGSLAKTYGFYELNDGGGATYKIREILNTDVIDNIKLFAIENNNTLVAELLIQDKMNIKQFGSKGDGINDDTLSIQTCLNNCRKIYIPSTDYYYSVTSTLNIRNGQKIYGNGEKSKILMANNLQEKIFYLHEIKDVIIENIKLCNESCQTGNSPDLGKNLLIYTDDVENLTIKNCYFENAYSRGIEIFKTKNFKYLNNNFKNATFCMLLLLPECENIIVDNCVFDNITSTYINTYLFATGRNDTTTYNFSCKNVHVTNSKFLNNPNWEGIDTHSCNGFYCENNYISNCKIGIVSIYGSTAPITSNNIKIENIYIKNNIIINPSQNRTYGISVGISDMSSFAKNINIENNYIDGFGNGNTIGALHLVGIKYSNINNNTIINCNGVSMDITGVIYSDIIANKCTEINSIFGVLYQGGCWFINFKDNVIKNNELPILTFGVRTSNLNISQFVDNDIVATTRYQSTGTIMNGTIGSSTTQIGKIGNYVKNEYGIITHYCTNNVIRPATTGAVSNVTLSGTIDTKTVTGTNSLYYLTEGEEITLPGAGTGGSDLTTIITEFISKDSFKIKDTILTSFNNQNAETTAGTWVAV